MSHLAKPKLIRTATLGVSLDLLLKGQLKFLNQHFEVVAVSGGGDHLRKVYDREGVRVAEVPMHRKISVFYDIASLISLYRTFKKEKPDIVLMDIQLPNKNGHEATREIRLLSTKVEIPIVAITAGIMIDEKEKCFESGMNDYLQKPIMVSDLEKVLLKWLTK